jgi:hypothetical protein
LAVRAFNTWISLRCIQATHIAGYPLQAFTCLRPGPAQLVDDKKKQLIYSGYFQDQGHMLQKPKNISDGHVIFGNENE